MVKYVGGIKYTQSLLKIISLIKYILIIYLKSNTPTTIILSGNRSDNHMTMITYWVYNNTLIYNRL